MPDSIEAADRIGELVPSAIVPEEHMVWIHPMHPDAGRLSATATAARGFEYEVRFRR